MLKKIVLTCSLLGFATVMLFYLNGCSVGNAEADNLIEAKADSLPETVDYNMHVKPILSDKCFNCHGPDKNKREAGLRLDTPEGAFTKLEGHYPIKPKSLGNSEVVERILSHDPEIVMPLANSNLFLTDLEKATIIKWIKQGAEYKQHWAFIPVDNPKVPKVKKHNWSKNSIDNFILSRLEKEKFQPSKEASKEKLARRLSFDLTGLSLDDEILSTYIRDTSTQAYEKLVDILLASPHYGERMAAEWMDAARYADSHGYQDDGESEMWPWRDWVINMFNKNMPFDAFIKWQISGDLLPNATQEQILATGFNRNHMINAEGGIIEEEFRTEYVLDRVNTTGKAILGITLECARCHDHKYDPISTKEYYAISGFFNRMNEHGIGTLYENATGPTMLLMDEKTEQKYKTIKTFINKKENSLNEYLKKQSSQTEQYRRSISTAGLLKNAFEETEIGYYSFDIKNIKDSTLYNLKDPSKNGKISIDQVILKGVQGNALMINGDIQTVMPVMVYNFERNETFSISMWINSPKNSINGFTLLSNCASIYHARRGYEFLLINGKLNVRISSSWPSNALSVTSKEEIKTKEWIHVAFSYDGSSKASGIHVFVNGRKVAVDINNDDLYRTIKTHTLKEDKEAFDAFEKLEKIRKLTLIEQKKKRQFSFKANYSKTHYFIIGGRIDQGVPAFIGGLVDELRIFSKRLTEPEVKAIYKNTGIKEIIKEGGIKKSEITLLYNDLFNVQWKHELDTLKKIRDDENRLILPLKEIKVMRDWRKERSTFVLNRGSYDAPGEMVTVGGIQSIMSFPDSFPKNRLGLAKWLIHEKNPLVGRVVVNRYWQMLFSNGLVSSSGDFGNQGSLPSHPQLLDWLAYKFVHEGWNVKKLLKLMVMSATYRQSSVVNPENHSRDPQNILLSRMHRTRFSYEMLRDNALASSGLINPKVGGPSFKPYQPAGLWEEKTESPVNNYYEHDKVPEIYRRSMYIFLKRTSPHPSYNAFDGPERFMCQVKRQSTNTPIQAIISLNDPQFFEAARVLAQKSLEKISGKLRFSERISYVFNRVLSRNPDQKELMILERMYVEELTMYKSMPKKAKKLINAGKYPLNKSIAPIELAALTMVSHTILNLDEAINKE